MRKINGIAHMHDTIEIVENFEKKVLPLDKKVSFIISIKLVFVNGKEADVRWFNWFEIYRD